MYRWWVNKRITERDVMDIEADVDAVMAEQEQGFGRDLDRDDVNFNPMAKPIGHINSSSNGGENEIADRAVVHVEKFNVRQQWGARA